MSTAPATRDGDVLIVGAGIAGAAAGFFLAADGVRVTVAEAEDFPGYHSTGRSAALFTESYGQPLIWALAAASRSFLENPPAGFAEAPLLTPRGLLHLARDDQRPRAEALFAQCRDAVADIDLIDGAAVAALVPVVRPDAAACAVHEPRACDIDVDALHQGYLRGIRAAGGTVVSGARIGGLERTGDGRWRAETKAGVLTAPVVVDAAGAWADELAGLAGLAPLGLTPKRRTAITFDPPDGVDPGAWPMVVDIDEAFYFKPDAGRVLVSPCDQTPSPPCDAQPEDLDVAIAVDRVETATTLPVPTIARKWAGLRSFFADKLPAAGFDPRADGFFWLAGQGGAGVLTSPAMGRLAAALVTGTAPPADLTQRGVTPEAVSPVRFL